jgi:hypothetical protein
MGALNILRDLQSAGVVFSLQGGAVRWRNGGQHMTPDRLAVLQADKAEVVAALSHPPDEASPHGKSVGAGPLTWTGKVVPLAEYRRLSEWGRHGSTGKVWNGNSQQWEPKP